ncbi:MAG: universal stress protein, partial [Alphaproteobacteria bacterium]|nr:universal stress protein [Alphaproteobacteria bacterium]
MSYKTILACLPADARADRILDTALPVARDNEAHFIGLHAIPRVPVIYGVVAAEIPHSIIVQQEEALAQRADTLKAKFLERCEKEGVRGEWRSNKVEMDDVASDVIGQALCAD